MIQETVELFLEKYNLLTPKNNIIVAFSGGYDSMCLLDVMKKIKTKYDLNIIAVHLNHNWRGEESNKEEENCKDFCDNITFYSEKLSSDIPHTETAAREARYDFFERCAKKFNSQIILTAHNANDNAETVFYRLVKGTGITGIEGIKEKRDIYYRPLLNVYRNDIEEYCSKNNLKPNNDSSNNDIKYARNKIRHEIFPVINEISAEFVQKLNKLSESARYINSLIDKQIHDLEKYKPSDFCNLEENMQSAIIHKFCRNQKLEYDRKKIENIVTFINTNQHSKSGKIYSLTSSTFLFVNNKNFKVINNKNENSKHQTEINSEGEYLFENYIFSIEPVDVIPQNFPKDNDYEALVNIDKIDFTLRNRQNGDIITPLGLNGTQKLKKYLNEKKIPNHEKDSIILLCQNNEVLWAAGLGISEKIKVVTKPTHMLKLRRGE